MSDKPPKWLNILLDKQASTIANLLSQNLSNNEPDEAITPQASTSKKRKHAEDEEEDTEDSDVEFDRKYGHLFGSKPDDSASSSKTPPQGGNANTGEDDTDDSDDEDLLDILDKVPNWDTSSSIKKFITKSIDRPLPEEVLKQISDDFTPADDLKDFFKPPEMPARLLKSMKKMKSKGAINTEKTLFSAQNQLFIITKPTISALIDLKPLGEAVSKARELLSISLRGLYSVSLKISHARRENARFLIKNTNLADALYSYLPTHSQLFGGTCFASQLEKAAKEAKIDLSWNKPPKRTNFHTQGSQGFHYNKGAGKYFWRHKGKQSSNNNNHYNNTSNYNNRKSNNKGYKGKNASGSQNQN